MKFNNKSFFKQYTILINEFGQLIILKRLKFKQQKEMFTIKKGS